MLFSPSIYDPARPCLRAFGFLHFSARLFNNYRLSAPCSVLFFSLPSPLLPYFFPPIDLFSPSRLRRRRSVIGYSTIGNTHLHRKVVCARASTLHLLYRLEFLGGQNVSVYSGSCDRSRRNCSRCKRSRSDHSLLVPVKNATPSSV